jgi:hypothetical protein
MISNGLLDKPQNVFCQPSFREAGYYCDQPIVSETTRCVLDDFIKAIDDQGQNAKGFYV